MKFAREFSNVLKEEGFPPHWIESAVPYGQLKKCIKRVQRELVGLGLDATTLGQLIQVDSDLVQEQAQRRDGEPPIAFRYEFLGVYMLMST